MSLDLMLVAAMGSALVFTAWMWVPPRRNSGLEPNHAQSGGADRDQPPRRIEPFIEPPVDFSDLVTIGAGGAPQLTGPDAEVTPEQRRVILLAAADELGRGDDQDEEQMPPMARGSEGRADDLRAARYGLIRLDGGVRVVGVDDVRTNTLPPAAVEDDL